MFNESLETVVRGKLLRVRPAAEAEFVDVAELRAHPLVAPYQYDPGPHFVENLKQIWDLAQERPEIHYGLYAITLDDCFIGSVTFVRYKSFNVIAEGSGEFGTPLNAGWDLHPDYWGNGYMTRALTLIFAVLFESDHHLMIGAECFSMNDRCIGLLKNLGFQSVPMPWLAKLNIKLRRGCYHKHLRFRLSKSCFENRPNQWGQSGA